MKTEGTGIDYKERVADACDFAQIQYGIDPFHMRIVLSSMLPPAEGYNPVWLAVDGERHPFWNHISLISDQLYGSKVEELAAIRGMRPRKSNEYVEKLLGDRAVPRIFLDRMYKEPYPWVHPRNRWPELIAQCVRMPIPLPPLRIPPLGTEHELSRRVKLALNLERRPFLPVPIRAPEMMSYAASLLCRVNPEFSEGPALLANLSLIPSSHAVLHGRDRLTDIDHQALYSVILGSIRPWTRAILEVFAEKDGMWTIGDLQIQTLLERSALIRECGRLADEAGVLDWPRPRWRGGRRKWIGWKWREGGVGVDVGRLVRGEMRWW